MQKSIYKYLKRYKEPLPEWLAVCNNSEQFKIEDFFSSRTVFYPGCGTDGHPVKLFNSSHSAHCYIYVDYKLPWYDFLSEIESSNHGFIGYHVKFVADLYKYFHGNRITNENLKFRNREKKILSYLYLHTFIIVMERNEDMDETHGAEKFAILFLNMDGVMAYEMLYCQKTSRKPFAFLLQDHGFGGNYTTFGAGGRLEEIAIAQQTYPELLVVADNSRPLKGFTRLMNVAGDPGGMHNHMRYLYKREPVELSTIISG